MSYSLYGLYERIANYFGFYKEEKKEVKYPKNQLIPIGKSFVEYARRAAFKDMMDHHGRIIVLGDNSKKTLIEIEKFKEQYHKGKSQEARKEAEVLEARL